MLNLWRHGLTMAAIAERRGASRYAIRYHLRNAAGKLGVDTTAFFDDPDGNVLAVMARVSRSA